MQKFNYLPVQPEEKFTMKNTMNYLSKTSGRKFKDDFMNAISSNPQFSDPNQAIRHHFNDWEENKLLLFRFRIPSKAEIV